MPPPPFQGRPKKPSLNRVNTKFITSCEVKLAHECIGDFLLTLLTFCFISIGLNSEPTYQQNLKLFAFSF